MNSSSNTEPVGVHASACWAELVSPLQADTLKREIQRFVSLIFIFCSFESAIAEPVSFKRDIAPILLSQCQGCHGPKKAKGSYRVDSFNRLVKGSDPDWPGITAKKLDKSEAFQRLITDDVDDRMPADADPLPKDQINLFQRWIAEGAKFDGKDPDAALISIIPGATHPAPPMTYPRPLPITALAFGPATNEITVSGYRELTIWDTTSGKLNRRIHNLPEKTMSIAIHPGGQLIATAGGNPGRLGEVRVFDSSGELLQILQRNADLCLSVAFSPDGSKLAVGSSDGTVSVYTTDTWRQAFVFSNHSDWVNAVAWNNDGTRLGSASRDHSAKVFDVQKRKRIATYTGHKKSVYDIGFRSDGQEVFTVGADGLLSRWRIDNARQVKPLRQTKLPGYRLVVESARVHGVHVVGKDPAIESIDFEAKSRVKQQAFASAALAVADRGDVIAIGGGAGEVAILDGKALHVRLKFIAAPGR